MIDFLRNMDKGTLIYGWITGVIGISLMAYAIWGQFIR